MFDFGVLVSSASGAVKAVLGWAREPRLSVAYDPRDDALISRDGSGEHLHIRLRVHNGGWKIAEDVAVRIDAAAQPEGGGVDAIPLRALKWADVDKTRLQIEPRRGRLVDLVAIERGADRMTIGLRKTDTRGRHTVPPGIYDFKLVASVRGGKPQDCEVRVIFTAGWEAEDDIRRHVAVSMGPQAHIAAEYEGSAMQGGEFNDAIP